MDSVKGLVTTQIPEIIKNASKSLQHSLDYFNQQEAFYLNEDIQKGVNIGELVSSSHEKYNKEALKFIVGKHLIGEDIQPFFIDSVKCLVKNDLENKILAHYIMGEINNSGDDLKEKVLSISTLMKVGIIHA